MKFIEDKGARRLGSNYGIRFVVVLERTLNSLYNQQVRPEARILLMISHYSAFLSHATSRRHVAPQSEGTQRYNI